MRVATVASLVCACGAATFLAACSATRAPAACDLLRVDEIASALQTTGVRQESGPGVKATTDADMCRWTADAATVLELRVYRVDASSESAWALVFESAGAHATMRDGRAHRIDGVGDEAMFLPGSGSDSSVAFRAGRTGAMIAGRASEAALVDLAKRAVKRVE